MIENILLTLTDSATASRWSIPIANACAEFGIDNPRRQAAFLCQIIFGSGKLSVGVAATDSGAFAKSAARFFRDTGCNQLADELDIDAISLMFGLVGANAQQKYDLHSRILSLMGME